MSKLSLNPKKRAKKVCERNTHFLAKDSFAPFPQKIEKQCVTLV